MKQILTRSSDAVFAGLRMILGFMFFCHGAQKVFGLFGKAALSLAERPQLWIGGLIELSTGLAVALGIFTRCAAVLASGTMAVAYFQFHVGADLRPAHLLPIVNGGDLAVVYCLTFLLIATRGAGVASLDRALGRERG